MSGILFSEIPYVETIEKEVKNELLIVDGLKTMVTVPSAECILGDKLTAFAPHTTGVPLGVGKSMEIAKQLFDVVTLVECIKAVDKFKILIYYDKNDIASDLTLEDITQESMKLII